MVTGRPSARLFAVLDYIEQKELAKRAQERGEQLRNGLQELALRYPVIGDVRGIGLMIGAELIHADGSPYPELLDDILESMKDRGFLVGKNGLDRNVMAFQPPLVIEKQDVEELLNALESVLNAKCSATK